MGGGGGMFRCPGSMANTSQRTGAVQTGLDVVGTRAAP